jgi:ABC-type transporter Mla MlaB component
VPAHSSRELTPRQPPSFEIATVFALFGKKSSKKNVDPSSIGFGPTRGDSMFSVKVPSNTPQLNPNLDPQVAEAHRKHQAEMSAKIDAIESEMAGEFAPPTARDGIPRKATPVPKGVELPFSVNMEPPAFGLTLEGFTGAHHAGPPTLPPLDMSTDIEIGVAIEDNSRAMTVTDIATLSPEIEEAAIFYANGQLAECETVLKDAILAGSAGREAWLLLFELYQQSSKQREFEALAMDFSLHFESSPPAWRVNRLVKRIQQAARVGAAELASVALPTQLDAMAVREIDAVKRQLKQMHRARLSFDSVTSSDEVGAKLVRDLFQQTMATTQELTLTGVEQAVHRITSHLIAGERSQPEQVWLLALDLYRVLGWERQFEDVAVDYSVSFEVSPPQMDGRASNIIAGSAANTSVTDTQVVGRPPMIEPSPPGTLEGEISGRSVNIALAGLEAAAALGDRVEVDCAPLTKVDFAAAGSLLNWLMSAQSRGKHFVFKDVNQLVAALFSVMGINGLAEVHTRRA